MSLIHSWLNPQLEVRKVVGSSYGIFAKEFIKFGGHIMPINDEPEFSDDKKDMALMIDEKFVIGTKYDEEIEDTDYFNHSCNPNAGIRGSIFLVSMRDINKDEQVCFDYAMCLHKIENYGEGKYEFTCTCGSENCRGVITWNDWMLPKLQEKYSGYFSWYLQDKIDKLSKKD